MGDTRSQQSIATSVDEAIQASHRHVDDVARDAGMAVDELRSKIAGLDSFTAPELFSIALALELPGGAFFPPPNGDGSSSMGGGTP